ncbi:MalM family protein [Vibrio tubiashii]|uniref:MalM family protein n=1 Tax=Vibrio tubiashii TaxID=29498 RepID=UPI001EFD0E2B|nr:MalM family protein [Vibrio tubiashii]MCG9577628.1 MalM family protein [Vibrio tubiashii]
MKKTWLSLLGLVVISGCSSVETISNEISVSEQTVAARLADVQWSPIEPPSTFLLAFNDNTQKFKVDGFESPIAGFSFENVGTSLLLELTASVKDLSVFSPNLNLYDQNMQLIKKYSSNVFDYDRNDFAKGEVLHGEIELVLPVSVTKVYALVYTTERDLESSTTLIHPAKAMAISKRNTPPAIEDPVATHSTIGQVLVSIKKKSQFNLFGSSKAPSAPNVPETSVEKVTIKAVPETQTYYHNAIQSAVKSNNLDKALSLLDEAKALNVEGAQEVFIKAVNAK